MHVATIKIIVTEVLIKSLQNGVIVNVMHTFFLHFFTFFEKLHRENGSMRNLSCQSTCLFSRITHDWRRNNALDLCCGITRFDTLPC